VAQTQAGVAVRLSKSCGKLREALIDLLQFGIGAALGPASPACAPLNREGSWRFRPTVWFFHAWLFC
jgi:hypothetical protein